MKKVFAILLASSLFAIGCGNGQKADADKSVAKDSVKAASTKPEAGWSQLDKPGYSLQYPQSWTLNEGDGSTAPLVQLTAPANPNDTSFRSNLNLVMEDLSQQPIIIDLEKYSAAAIDQLKTSFTDFKIIENKHVKSGDMDYEKLVYTGGQGGVKLQIEQCFQIVNKKAWIFSYGSLPEHFKECEETASKVMASLRVKN